MILFNLKSNEFSYLIIHKQVASRFDRRQYPKRKSVLLLSSTTNAKCSLCSSLLNILKISNLKKQILRRYFAWIGKIRCGFKNIISEVRWIFDENFRSVFFIGFTNLEKNFEKMFGYLSKNEF